MDDTLPTDRRAPTDAKTVGRFVIDRELGAGGMGTVMLAHDPTLDRQVAIKLVRDDGRGSASAGRMRMLREAQAMARLRHPNVVMVYEAGVHEDQVYIVMEYLAGGTLRAKLRGKRTVAEALALFVDAGRGLAAAHKAGLVHRDFKPENVLVDEAGVVKVTDFGLAAQHGTVAPVDSPSSSRRDVDALSFPLTQTGDVMGTPKYMAPEQHEGKPTDARSDQFSFCVALYEALYGKLPWECDHVAALTMRVINDPPDAPPDRTDVPARVRAAILRGLAKSKDERFPTMEALLAELVPAPRKRRWPLLAGAVAAAAAVGVAILVAWPSRPGLSAVERAQRMGQVLDAELLDIVLPADTNVVAVRRISGGFVLAPTLPLWQATGQLALPRGEYVLEYMSGKTRAAYAVISRGGALSRKLTLPPIESREGFVFVGGGQFSIGSPAAVMELEPYLIGVAEHRLEVTFDDARKAAFEAHARLPSSAEWELAARLGVIEHPLQNGWEWTATRFAPHPYIADGRDGSFAPRKRSEVRGQGKYDERAEGAHKGRADLRLALTPLSVPRLTSVTVKLDSEPPGPDGESPEVVAAPSRAELDRFLVHWIQLDPRPPLLVEGHPCTLPQAVRDAGVRSHHMEVKDDGPGSVRFHPNPAYQGTPVEREAYCTRTTSTEILDRYCFDGDRLHPASLEITKAVATTLKGNPSIRRVEIQGYVPGPDGLARSQRRAETVRNHLIAEGVAAERLIARGYGAVPENKLLEPDKPEPPSEEPPREDKAPCPEIPGERIAFLILERD